MLPSNGDIYVGSADNSIYMFNQAGQRKDTIIGRARTGDGELNRYLSIFIKETKCILPQPPDTKTNFNGTDL